MAKRRGAASKKGRGGGGGSDVAGKLALYALATIGGCYLGSKALNLIPHDDLAKEKPSASKHAAPSSTEEAPRHTVSRRPLEAPKESAEAEPKEAPKKADAGKFIDAKADAASEQNEVGRGEADTAEEPAVTIKDKSDDAQPAPAAKLAPAAKSTPTTTPTAKPAKTPASEKTQGAEAASPDKSASRHPYPPVEVDHGSTKRKEVALTFDAGSDWKPVRKIVTTLASENIKTTFFLTGEWVKKNPRSTHLIADSGHELGNHSWDHPAFTKLSDDEIKDQLRRTDEVIKETVGRPTEPYFRPPLGARDTRVKRVVGNEGYMTIYWTLDSRDSVDKGITAEQIRDRVISKATPGSIVLLHCGSQATADALPEIIKGLKEKGMNIVPVSRLIQQ